MRARVPLDVDLEDRLVYGLTPIRLVYVVLAILACLATWSSHWAPAMVRGCAAALLGLMGCALAWGRWRGRAADSWMTDMAIFTARSYQLTWDPTAELQEGKSLEDVAA